MAGDSYRPGGRMDDRRDDRGYENYRPRYDDRQERYNDSRSHPNDYHHPRRSPPRGSNPGGMRRFGDRGATGNNTNNDFSFRSGNQAEFRGGQPSQAPRRFQKHDNKRPYDRRNGNRNPQAPRRRWQPPPPTADREILHAKVDGEGTPERLLGMREGLSRFKNVEDWDDSSSEGEAMDIASPPAEDGPAAKKAKITNDLFVGDDNENEDEEEVGGETKVMDEVQEEKPKWCNPDPYFTIPPIDESRAKRKDVLHLIRKAKADTEKASGDQGNAVTRNADFISFGDDDDDDGLVVNGNGPVDASRGKRDDGHFPVTSFSEEGEVASADEGSDDSGSYEPPAVIQLSNPNQPPTTSLTSSVNNSLPPSAPAPTFSHLKNLHKMPNDAPAPAPAPGPPPIGTTPAFSLPEPPVQEVRNLLQEYDMLDQSQSQASASAKLAADSRARPGRGGRGGRQARDGGPHGRKRKFDDEGDIIESWKPKDRASSAPWYIDHSKSADMSFWLHQEVCDFYDFIRPRQFEQAMRKDLVERIESTLRKPYQDSRLLAFGSYGQGIYLPTSDMDLVLESSGFRKSGKPSFGKQALHRIAALLIREGIAGEYSMTVITKAKVPIVKFIDRLTGIHCDISFDNDGGIRALETFDNWRSTWPFLPSILSVLKQWLLMRDLNEVFTGGLGGFSLTCMVVSLLQLHPRYQAANVGDGGLIGEFLLEFLDFYGNRFNMNKTGINTNPPGYFDKVDKGIGKDDRWTIVNPNSPFNDMSVGSHKARLLQAKFSDAHKSLVETMERLKAAGRVLREGQSLLRLLIGGNYDRVILHRSVLRQVHEEEFGPANDDPLEYHE